MNGYQWFRIETYSSFFFCFACPFNYYIIWKVAGRKTVFARIALVDNRLNKTRSGGFEL
jgi:fibronectin type 3 domain-containing protein